MAGEELQALKGQAYNGTVQVKGQAFVDCAIYAVQKAIQWEPGGRKTLIPGHSLGALPGESTILVLPDLRNDVENRRGSNRNILLAVSDVASWRAAPSMRSADRQGS